MADFSLENINLDQLLGPVNWYTPAFGGLVLAGGLGGAYHFLNFSFGAGDMFNQLATARLNNYLLSLSYLIGLFSSGLVMYMFFKENTFSAVPVAPWFIYLIAGLCVGFGGRMCNGCTHKHGLLGVARFSTRSILATVTMLFAAVVYTSIVNGLIYNPEEIIKLNVEFAASVSVDGLWKLAVVAFGTLLTGILFSLPIVAHMLIFLPVEVHQAVRALLFSGSVGFGLGLAGLLNQQNIRAAFSLVGAWNATLPIAYVSALLVLILVVQVISGVRHHEHRLSWGLFVGAAIFGVGLAMIGLDPATFITMSPRVIFEGMDGAFTYGMFLAGLFAGVWAEIFSQVFFARLGIRSDEVYEEKTSLLYQQI